VRNDVPGGEHVGEFPPSGVERAGGARGEGLIERLRGTIRRLEQVPVSLAFPLVPGAGLPRPACSLISSNALSSPSPGLTRGLTRRSSNPRSSLEGPLEQTGRGQWLLDAPVKPGHDTTARLETDTPPLGKLAASGLHEIRAATYRDHPAALAFALAVLGEHLTRQDRAPSPVLWCLTERAAREWGAPYGPGLLALGLDPALVLIVQARNALDAAWALEEGLKAQAFIAALGQVEVKTPLIARRLGLAAQTSRTPCLLLSGHQGGGLPGTLTRWRVAAAGSSPAPFDASAPGTPCWHLTLERCRGIAPGQSWTVEFRHVAYGFRLAAAFVPRTAEAGEERRALSG
jgi:protein ImuA